MFQIISAVILGIIQGLGEFLPISSSGHLILGRYLFNLDIPLTNPKDLIAFDVALHFGTGLAVLFYFRKSLQKRITAVLQALKNPSKETALLKIPVIKENIHLLILLFVASIPGGIAGFFLEDFIAESLRGPLIVILSLIFYALLLWLADFYATRKNPKSPISKNLKIVQLSPSKAFIIGCFQALALIPGTSRSGASITGSLFLGLNRENAARFSFIISVPLIFGAAVLELPKLLDASISWLTVLAGLLAAFFTGFLSIKYMLKYLTSHGYLVFVIYRLLLAAVVLGVIFN